MRETGQPSAGPNHIQRCGGDDVLESGLGQSDVFGAAQPADVDRLGECAFHAVPAGLLLLKGGRRLPLTGSPESLLLLLRTEAISRGSVPHVYSAGDWGSSGSRR